MELGVSRIETPRSASLISNIVVPAVATATAAAVSSAVFISLTTTGDITATVVGRSIGIGGVLLGHGAEYLLGPVAGDTMRILGFLGENTVRPAISSGSRTVAMGASIVAGAATAGVVAAASAGGKLLFDLGVRASQRWLPVRYIPTPADSDAILDALAGTPRIQGIVRNLPIAAGFNASMGIIQALTPLEAAECIAAAPWEVIATSSSFTAHAAGEEVPHPAFGTSDSESETPRPFDAESVPEEQTQELPHAQENCSVGGEAL